MQIRVNVLNQRYSKMGTEHVVSAFPILRAAWFLCRLSITYRGPCILRHTYAVACRPQPHHLAFCFHQLIRTQSNILVIQSLSRTTSIRLVSIPRKERGKGSFICVEANQQILHAKQDQRRVFALQISLNSL